MSREVLLVDPDLDALGELASALRSKGLKVYIADTPESAQQRTRRSLPDVILVAESLAADRMQLPAPFAPRGADVPVFVLVDSEPSGEELRRDDADTITRRVLGIGSRPPPVAAEAGDFRGDLKQVGVVDLLQLLCMNRRTGVLVVNTTAGVGEIRMDSGEIVDAVYRRHEGEKALYRVLSETDGSFAFSGAQISPLRRIETPTNHLLMEGMRRIDEVRDYRTRLGAEQDALVSLIPPSARMEETERRIAEALTVPRTLDELLDDLPIGDLELLRRLDELLSDGSVRRVPKGAMRAELGSPEQLQVLGALVKRLHREGYLGAARMLMAGSPKRLATVAHALQRIVDAAPPAESIPAAPVPHPLATLRLGEGVELELVGLPTLEAFAPIWTLSLAGSLGVVTLEGESSVLERACAAAEVPLVDHSTVVEMLDEADPAQLAELVRSSLELIASR